MRGFRASLFLNPENVMVRHALVAACERLAWVSAGVIVGAVSASTVFSQQPPPPPPNTPAAQVQPVQGARVLTGDIGLVLNFIKPDKVDDFEKVIVKVKDALTHSAKPERQEQAKSWRVYKSTATGAAAGASALYVYIIDPPVKGADYSVSEILGESASGDDLTKLIKQYQDAYYPGQNFVDLALVSDFGKATPPPGK